MAPVRIIGTQRLRTRNLRITPSSAPSAMLTSRASSVIREAAERALGEDRECLGLLYGQLLSDGRRFTALVLAAEELPSRGTAAHVRVDKESLFRNGQAPGRRIVGWFHSHTGAGSFMSETDIVTHQRWFKDQMVAIVYEAVHLDMKAYILSKGAPVEIPVLSYPDGVSGPH